LALRHRFDLVIAIAQNMQRPGINAARLAPMDNGIFRAMRNPDF
jgi:hypothetical protein